MTNVAEIARGSLPVDAMLSAPDLAGITAQTQAFATAGYSGVWSSEVAHEPFMQLLTAAGAAPGLQLGTAISVAFAHNPMTLAYAANDLQRYTDGRFVLGLGSQVKAHIERRFGMPWSHPAPRMHEYIAAMRAIWHAWATGERLDFRGDFYTHTLMTPFFTPPVHASGPPSIYLAAVGERMTAVAGAIADGLLVHPFSTREYLVQRTLPAIERARAKAGRDGVFTVCVSAMVVTGRDDGELEAATDGVRAQLAFYGSTPAYRCVLEQHGWGALGDELNRLARTTDEDRWRRMAELVDDTMVQTFAVVAEPERLGAAIVERFGGIADRFQLSAPYPHEGTTFQPAVDALRASGAAHA
jgi:probable F420-dependent oxidoreductase